MCFTCGTRPLVWCGESIFNQCKVVICTFSMSKVTLRLVHLFLPRLSIRSPPHPTLYFHPLLDLSFYLEAFILWDFSYRLSGCSRLLTILDRYHYELGPFGSMPPGTARPLGSRSFLLDCRAHHRSSFLLRLVRRDKLHQLSWSRVVVCLQKNRVMLVKLEALENKHKSIMTF